MRLLSPCIFARYAGIALGFVYVWQLRDAHALVAAVVSGIVCMRLFEESVEPQRVDHMAGS